MNLFKHRRLTADALTGLGLDAAIVHPMLEPGDVLAFPQLYDPCDLREARHDLATNEH
jgi:hypothetical protein